ncbi:TPR-like protein [Armillaria gallica]|uniref:TPR-like protein n=1 Tax=Armillaria gallica TaxID=47427 RepID=A0A2H3E1X7_ARMGA|nr:TPR-like protein [Armillaria gallica]
MTKSHTVHEGNVTAELNPKSDSNDTLSLLQRDDSLENEIMKTHLANQWDINNLDEMVQDYRQALSLNPLGHPDRPSSLTGLGDVLYVRFLQGGRQLQHLDESIKLHQEAIPLYDPEYPGLPDALSSLAVVYMARFGQRGDINDLDETIALHRHALSLRPPGNQDRVDTLHDLACAIQRRFDACGRAEDLEEAITLHRQALVLQPPGHPDRAISLNQLAVSLRSRFERLNRPEDITESITSFHKALANYPRQHPDYALTLGNLGSALEIRYREQGQVEDLENALAVQQEALQLFHSDNPDRLSCLNNLANVMVTRFKTRGGSVDVLTKAIEFYQEIISARSDNVERAKSINNLASTLLDRFEYQGQFQDLDEAIILHRQSLSLRPHGHPERADSLINFAVALVVRFNQQGGAVDLDEAITHLREALSLCPPGHLDRSMVLNNLANDIRIRFERSRSLEDLNEAIQFHRAALDLSPEGHPDRPSSLYNLGIALLARFENCHDIEDLHDSISLHREAVQLHPPGHQDRAMALNYLSIALGARFSAQGKEEDLDQAIVYGEESEQLAVRTNQPTSARISTNLGMSYALRGNIDLACSRFESATTYIHAVLEDRFQAARVWADKAHNYKHPSALTAYRTALVLVERCLVTRTTVELQREFLARSETKNLPALAAACAIELGALKDAVEMLEQGRGLLWSKLRDYRSPLEAIHRVSPELADTFKEISLQLEHLATSSASSSWLGKVTASLDSSAAFDTKVQQQHLLSKKWDETISKIRMLDGFQDFLQIKPFETLKKAAGEGPVIIINITKIRSDVVIVLPSGSLQLVPLSSDTPDAMSRLVRQVAELGRHVRKTAVWNSNGQKSVTLAILRKLWTQICGQVARCLHNMGIPEQSRIWWCPTGPISSLPLHAAGPFSPEDERSLMDMYMSSYTPTLCSLIQARRLGDSQSQNQSMKLLAVGQSNSLSKVKEELRRIEHLFANQAQVLDGNVATPDAVIAQLRDTSWVHFACHGHLETLNPFESSFILHQGNLSLLQIMDAHIPDANLAFLAACHSAAGDKGVPDEILSLAAAIQFCGFRSVVGTLWTMSDKDGPELAQKFYSYMLREGVDCADWRNSAMALHLAVQNMRHQGIPAERWATFIHIGA